MLGREGISMDHLMAGTVPGLDPEAMLERARHENDEPGTDD